MTEDEPQATTRRARRLLPYVLLVGALVVGGGIGWGVSTLTTSPILAGQQEEIIRLESALSGSESALEVKTEKLEEARDALEPQQELDVREAKVTSAETSLAERQAAADEIIGREATVAEREAAVTARENSSDWWIERVRECLARPGSYRMASATEGSLGRDVSCLSG